MENPKTNFQQKITGFLERRPVIYQFLRFGCIGSLNTALNFLILNSISKALNISQGLPLGAIGAVAFCAAVVQSYLWNRTWTFGGEAGVSLWMNVQRLFLVGCLGGLTVILVLAGSKASAPWFFYLGLLVVYLLVESIMWRRFGFHISDWNHEGHSFIIFFIVTAIGLGINVTVLSLVSLHVHLTANPDLNKNIAAIMATGISLFWNFVGYKVVVFKK